MFHKKEMDIFSIKRQLSLLVFVLLSTVLNSSGACELTEKYKNLRTEITKAANNAYGKCTSSVSNAQYWYAFSQCFEAADGKNVGGGCGHLAQYIGIKYKTLPINSEFCSILKPDSKEMIEAFKAEVESKGINKCK